MSQNVVANVPFNMTLYRLVPEKAYKIELSDASGVLASTNFTVGALKLNKYNVDQVFAQVTGNPTFDLIVVDQADGLAAFDQSGWVVWHSAAAGQAWDWYPGHTIASLPAGAVHDAGNGVLHNSSINAKIEINATGNFGLSHEAHIDQIDGGVLSISSTTRNISGMTKAQRGSSIVKWDRTTDKISELYNLFDYFNASVDRGECSDSPQKCGPLGGNTSEYVFDPKQPAAGDDWTHANAASRGTQDNYIMSVRHLSAVVSWKADGTGMDWVMSGEGVRPSLAPNTPVFTYDKPTSHHDNQHCVRQLPNGNIMLFDNGDVRPAQAGDGSIAGDGAHFSRLAEYKLDKTAMVATLVWEFRPTLANSTSPAYSFHAGAIHRQDNGNTVGTASCDSAAAGSGCTHVVYEADAQGKEVGRATVLSISTGDDDEASDDEASDTETAAFMGYRGVPVKSLGGEFFVKKNFNM
jgi:hypothetical protein